MAMPYKEKVVLIRGSGIVMPCLPSQPNKPVSGFKIIPCQTRAWTTVGNMYGTRKRVWRKPSRRTRSSAAATKRARAMGTVRKITVHFVLLTAAPQKGWEAKSSRKFAAPTHCGLSSPFQEVSDIQRVAKTGKSRKRQLMRSDGPT